MLRAAFNVVAVRGQAGKPAAVLGIGQDVTALRQLQSQVIHAEKLATLGQIAAGVAHEINNPLTSVQVCAATVARKASLALEGKGPTVFDRHGPRIGCARSRTAPSGSGASPGIWSATPARRAARSRRSPSTRCSTSRSPSASTCWRARAPSWSGTTPTPCRACRRCVTRSCRSPSTWSPTPPTRSSPEAARSASGPGSRAGPPSGSPSPTAGWASSDEDRGKIFDPFFTTKPAGKGTGLGLSVVRNIIYSHGGQISFQSRPGSGTTFMVTLPVTPLGPPENKEEIPPI